MNMLTKEQIIQKLGIDNLSQVEQDEQLQTLADTVASRITQKLTELLDESDVEKLGELIDTGKDDEVAAYLRGKVDNYDEWNAKIELDTINELENNRKAIIAEVEAAQEIVTPTD